MQNTNRTGVNRRQFVKAVSVSTGILGFAPLLGQSTAVVHDSPERRKKPNVLYVFSDMQRAHSMGCYGDGNARTPVLDKFAAQGARFDAAMSNTPVCCPHRACLMSGQYAHHHGMMSNSVHFLPKVKCFAETFRAAGYATAYVGKWHLDSPKEGSDTRRFGFPVVNDRFAHYKTEHVVRPCADKTIEFIKQLCASSKPWLCMLSWLPPHTPYRASQGYAAHFKGLAIPPNVPNGAPRDFASNNLPDYYGMIEEIDMEFGRILSALDAAGVADDTIVVFSSDHGDMIGAHGYKFKRWPFEESARVPLLARYPKAIQPHTVIHDPIGTPDIYPTLAGLAGVTIPAGLDGLDFSGFVAGKGKAPRDYVYLEMPYAYVPWPGSRAIRTCDYMYAHVVNKPWLLFDMRKDPWQTKNLIDDPASRSLVGEMDKRLLSIMKESGDSWHIKATSGDLNHWLPGGQKQQEAYLGVTWPGCGVTGSQAKGKKGKKHKGAGSGAAEG